MQAEVACACRATAKGGRADLTLPGPSSTHRQTSANHHAVSDSFRGGLPDRALLPVLLVASKLGTGSMLAIKEDEVAAESVRPVRAGATSITRQLRG